MEENKLDFYIEKYGSDKKKSGYTYYYDKIFSSSRDEVKSVLEIGIGTLDPTVPSSFCGIFSHYEHYKPGGSLRAWRDYFPNAQIYGVDVADDCKFTEERIETSIFSSLDKEKIDETFKGKMFDFILDDGLHTAIAQLTTLQNLFSYVKDGGIYAIEDCGGGIDDYHIWVDFIDEFLNVIGDHEYVMLGNSVIVRKNYSGNQQVHNRDAFFLNEASKKN